MTSPQPRFRLAELVDTWVLRVALAAWAIALVSAIWETGSMARWFAAIAGATTLVATLPFVGPIGIRRTRFIAGATTASAGAVLTLQLGFMIQRPDAGDPEGSSGAIALSLITAAVGGWIAEERLGRLAAEEQRRRDELAAARHAEVLSALRNRPRPYEPLRPHEPLRVSELALAALAVAVLRRR